MSDLHEPDLDRAFAALTSDLSIHSSAPGAGAAMTTARKRRRTRMGAVALVAAAAVAAVTLPQLVGDSDNSSIAGGLDLPAAALLSAESLTEATNGWNGAWQDIDESNASTIQGLDSNCLEKVGGPETEPQRVGDRIFVSDGGVMALAIFVDYDNFPAGAGEYSTLFDNGMRACGAQVSQSAYGDAVVTHAAAGGAGSDVDELWFARLGDRVAMLSVMGAATPASADAADDLGDLLLGALLEDSSYDTSSGALSLQVGEGSASATPASFNDIPLAQIREATGAWSKEWTGKQMLEFNNLPCVSASWPESGAWSQGSTIGDRGMLTYGETDRATAEISDLTASLYACSAGPWSIHEGAGARSTAMWAAYDGGSLFVAEHEGYVAALQVTGLDVPSDETATRLIGMLEQNLANPESYSGTTPRPSETAEP